MILHACAFVVAADASIMAISLSQISSYITKAKAALQANMLKIVSGARKSGKSNSLYEPTRWLSAGVDVLNSNNDLSNSQIEAIIQKMIKEGKLNDLSTNPIPYIISGDVTPIVTPPSVVIPPAVIGINVVNPGNGNDIQPNIQTALNAAVDGDTLIIPAGNFIFNSVITTTKKISLYSTGCTLYRSEAVSDATLLGWGSMFIFNINDRASSGITVRGITFKSKVGSITPNDGGSTCADYLLKFINCTGFIVTACAFQNFGNAAIYVQHYDDLASGLIYSNTFTHCKGYDGLGLGYGVVIVGNCDGWESSPQFGTGNFIFIENNTFDGCRHAIAGAGSALYVGRYNIILNNLIGQGLDAHERMALTGLNKFAVRACEFYNNTLTNTTFKITQFANAAARAAFVPYNNGSHYAIQLDTLVTYVSNGLSAGNWVVASLPIPTRNGPAIIAGKNAQELANNSTIIRGGESLVHSNTITGYRYGVGLIDFTLVGGTTYPIAYSCGWASGVSLGSGHTGVGSAEGDGDLWVWSNAFTPYVDGFHSSLVFLNYQPSYFIEDRDYHLVAKPGYVAYTYPHPNRL